MKFYNILFWCVGNYFIKISRLNTIYKVPEQVPLQFPTKHMVFFDRGVSFDLNEQEQNVTFYQSETRKLTQSISLNLSAETEAFLVHRVTSVQIMIRNTLRKLLIAENVEPN